MKPLQNNILTNFKRRWQLLLGLEALMYALGFAILAYLLKLGIVTSILIFVVAILISMLMMKPWQLDYQKISGFIDQNLEDVEYSTGLLLKPIGKLSNIARLQQQKISQQLSAKVKNISPPHHLLRGSLIALLLIISGFLIQQFNLLNYFSTSEDSIPQEIISFQAIDSVSTTLIAPKISSQSVTIYYPNYTEKSARKLSDMNVKAVEGSQLKWELTFDKEISKVIMESQDNDYEMTNTNGKYSRSSSLNNSGFYSFKFIDTEGNSHVSDLYSIEVTKDQSPNIEINDLKQFSSFNYFDEKVIQLNTTITDDYGIDQAFIIATVSKGSGESVKFREEKLNFDNDVKRGRKLLQLSKKIDLDQMNMEPGDELYFYIQASDYKQPESNISRSETYFAAIIDTTSYEFSVEGTLGVDRMPDYFRSQRQLIIDTEKLISQRKNLTEKEFNFISNELGYDQKALRLKYSEFMGEETETDGGVINQENLESLEADQSDENSGDEEDPLAEYTHDHDGDNEHNLVDNPDEKDSEDPLDDYMHDHEDPESATLFEESLKTKLLKALNEMWDSELYLRLYDPEKSLPYQYRALKLIQEIKNSARIYVHRIGFDPPPIKEDKRLTGNLDAISNFRKSENIKEQDLFPFIRLTITRIEQLLVDTSSFTERDQLLFDQAGNELAALAIEFPGKYLMTLQQLKRLSDHKELTKDVLIEVQKGLLSALPIPDPNSSKSNLFKDKINQLLLKELQVND